MRARHRGPSIAVAAVLSALAAVATARAAGDADASARELAARYAPIVVVRNQDGPCDRDGEPYRPVPVDTVLGVPGVRLVDEHTQPVKDAPTMADIVGRGPGTSLDFHGNPRRPGCTYEQDFDRLGKGLPNVAYAHVATQASAPGRLALQYWLFWYFDDYVNTHEGDWEFIQLVWDVGTVDEALRTAPAEAGYSQHSGGEQASWGGGKLERDGDHPVVYAAAGSHANFYTPDLFLGRSADEGFGCDDARAPGTPLRTEARLLPSGEVDPKGPDAWLLFEGRWGEFQPTPYDAPPGPRTKDEWTEPITWQDSLRDGSFAVPSGMTFGPTATGAFCALVSVGGRIYTAVTSPLVLVLLVVGIVVTGTAAANSTTWRPRVPHPIRRTRAAGQMIGSARAAYRERRRLLVPIGLLFLPAAVLEVALQQVVLELTPLGDLTATAGRSSLVSIALALLVAGAGHVLAATVVVGGVALVLDAVERGGDVGTGDALRMTLRAAPRLLRTAIRVTVVTSLLAITIVGIPLAVANLGRWAVAVQASALEDLRPGPALARSRALVRGRWWRTAVTATTVNVVAAISGPLVGIVLLFLTPLPLATINAVSSAVFVFAMPLAGAALAFLYGDLVARAGVTRP